MLSDSALLQWGNLHCFPFTAAQQPILFEAIQVPSGTTGGCPDTTQTRATIYSELRSVLQTVVTNCTSDNYVG